MPNAVQDRRLEPKLISVTAETEPLETLARGNVISGPVHLRVSDMSR